MTLISLGGLNSNQSTETTPGSYSVDIAALTTNPQVTFQGPGTYTLTGVVSLLSTYTLEATNGAVLDVSGLAAAATTANLIVDGASTISLETGISALNVINASFTGSGGTLNFASGLVSLLDTQPTVTGFAAGDNINFGTGSVAGDIIAYAPNEGNTSGVLTLENSSGTPIAAVTLNGSYTQSDFGLGATGIDFATPCFLRGTAILTPSGEVSVETLQAGDLVSTLSNGPAKVKAVRLRSITEEAEIASAKNRPVCIIAGALGENIPHRDLYISPDHSMYLEDVLVPAQLLVNGVTITQPRRSDIVDYFHVEIEPHDIIIAENTATESYLDIGNQSHFSQPGVITLFPAAEPKTWEDACAPLVLAGPQLERIQASLLERAAQISNHRGYFTKVA